ncbi:MAG: hypothetical protein E6J90_41155 [Deltaproteobacteria bacterium]|nr:MAG: hypothetical protein E6J90_41155 [Deltaproteobacteria bacterium]TMQ19194.1 MAG: hypothetical protein E6J91_06570 [Deltaproteobacteria bacterium]
MTPRSFAFRPRYRGLAWSSIGLGGAVAAVSAVLGFVTMPLVAGALGIALGAAYLRSSTWRIAVTVDDAGLAVGSPGRLRFRLAWADIVKVVASPATSSCYVDGGAPERSLLVPGDGAPALYDIADRRALVEAIVAHVPADRVQTVASLDQATPAPPAK